MADPLLIGLHGLAESGKDTVGGLLARQLRAATVAIADEVRADLLVLDPLVTADCRLSQLVAAIGWDAAKRCNEVRRLLQVFGTEIVRERVADENHWIRRAREAINAPLLAGRSVIVTDVRFDNEAHAIRGRGGVIVRVVGRGGLVGEPGEHVSEWGISPQLIDDELVNDCDLDQLPDRVLELVTRLKGLTSS